MFTPRIPDGARQFSLTCDDMYVKYKDPETNRRFFLLQSAIPRNLGLKNTESVTLSKTRFKKLVVWSHNEQAFKEVYVRVNNLGAKNLYRKVKDKVNQVSLSYETELKELEPVIQKKLDELSSIPKSELSPTEIKKIVGFIETNKNMISKLHASGGGHIRRCRVLPRSLYVGRTGEIYILCKKHQEGSEGIGKGTFKTVTLAIAYNQIARYANAVTKLASHVDGYGVLTPRKRIKVIAKHEADIGILFRGKPNIAQYHEVIYYRSMKIPGRSGGAVQRTSKQSVLLPYYSGGELFDKITAGPISPKECYQIIEGCLTGLGIIHEAGIIHRDIKPENIWLDDHGNPMFGDFGLATEEKDRDRVALICGSYHYAAPEMWTFAKSNLYDMREQNLAKLTTKMDVYALGLVFGALAFKIYPHYNKNTDVYNEKYMLMEKPPENTLDFLIWSMTRTDPEDRITIHEALAMWQNIKSFL